MSDRQKITDGHRRRRAVVYVRQSTPTQLEGNAESRARRYALRGRAVELGWDAASVSVVDGDTRRSGASADGRLGFRELVAEVGLGRSGWCFGQIRVGSMHYEDAKALVGQHPNARAVEDFEQAVRTSDVVPSRRHFRSEPACRSRSWLSRWATRRR
jgi:hypothetical protein